MPIFPQNKLLSQLNNNTLLENINTKDEELQKIEKLIKLANEAEEEDNYEEAIYLLEEILKIEKRIFGEKSKDVANTLDWIGTIYQNKKDFQKALDLQKKVLNIYESEFKKDYRKINSSLLWIGYYQGKLLKFQEAENILEKALKIAEKYLANKDIAITKYNQAALFEEQFLAKEALVKYLESLQIYEKEFGKGTPETAEVLFDIGRIYSDLGLLNKSEDYILRAISIEKDYRFLDSLSQIYFSKQLHKKSLEIAEEALTLRKKVLVKNDIYLTSSLSTIAIANHLIGEDTNKTKKSLEAIKQILIENENQKNSGIYATALYTLGMAYYLTEDYSKAENVLQKSINIYKNLHGQENPYLSRPNQLIGLTYLKSGKNKKAEKYFSKAFNYSQKFFYKTYNYRQNSAYLGIAFSRQKKFSKAIPYFKESIELELDYIQNEAPFTLLSDRSEAFNIGNIKDYLVWQGLQSKEGLKLATYYWLNRKGLLEEIEKYQSVILNSDGSHSKLVNELKILVQKISASTTSPEERKDLRKKQIILEKKLYKIIPKFNSKIFNLNEIINLIPESGVLIEYMVYRPFDPKTRWQDYHYLALIINSKGEIKAVELGPKNIIDKKIRNALYSSEQGLSDAHNLWNQVSKLILKPLRENLDDKEIIFFSPDAELNLVSFSTLKLEDDSFLTETHKIRLLTTGRELINLYKRKPNTKYNKSLVVADPSFDLDIKVKNLKKNAMIFENEVQKRSDILDSKKWPLLPGTQQEGKAITKLINANYLTKDNATTLSIQKENSPKILHIASHSYFTINQDSWQNPLLSSGIVLAGANNPNLNPNDDGYLTALEVTRLDLQNTELAVVSGCDSNKGFLKSGEGIYGLKRSISIAGARSSLLSLWKVNDYGTAAFMESFYLKLKNGEGRNEALANTQKEFRNHPIEAWRHPNVWAAFQLSGDWRPIDF